MSILKVARMGHPVLRSHARSLDPTDIRSGSVQKLIDDMFDTLAEYQGIGLAAPQVHESLRLFVAGTDREDEPLPKMVFINPELTPLTETMEEDWEGCLSIPDVRGRVARVQEVRVCALDREGKTVDMTANGLPARVVQHEIDHLHGILFLDRMKSFDSLTFVEEYSRYLAKQEE